MSAIFMDSPYREQLVRGPYLDFSEALRAMKEGHHVARALITQRLVWVACIKDGVVSGYDSMHADNFEGWCIKMVMEGKDLLATDWVIVR